MFVNFLVNKFVEKVKNFLLFVKFYSSSFKTAVQFVVKKIFTADLFT
jgi:hypothetical protein